MKTLLAHLIQVLDLTVYPQHIKQRGMPLLRGRMLSLGSVLTFLASFSFLSIVMATSRENLPTLSLYIIMVIAAIALLLNRLTRYNSVLSAGLIILISIIIAFGIFHQARSLFAAGFLWFQVLILPSFLLCGWRLGLKVSSVVILVAVFTVGLCLDFGPAMPYGWDRSLGLRSMLTILLVINTLTLGMVSLYFHLLRESERGSLEQKTWLQRTARMQELLQMSGHFALKTNGPLDVLGTALHNLEEPLQHETDPKVLLRMLGPVESGIQELAAVSRSFSLFSKRYLEEGLEQTSFNAVLQHVDTIYNVGAVLRRARLDWKPTQPDVRIYTQTAKLVMLLVSLLRRIGAEGGTQLKASAMLQADGLHITLSYETPHTDRVAVPSDVDVVFDPELNEDLMQELCQELGITRRLQVSGSSRVYRLVMQQALCQARLA